MAKELKATKLDIDGAPNSTVTPIVDAPATEPIASEAVVVSRGGNTPGELPPSQRK